jgi:hypothetical protein
MAYPLFALQPDAAAPEDSGVAGSLLARIAWIHRAALPRETGSRPLQIDYPSALRGGPLQDSLYTPTLALVGRLNSGSSSPSIRARSLGVVYGTVSSCGAQ